MGMKIATRSHVSWVYSRTFGYIKLTRWNRFIPARASCLTNNRIDSNSYTSPFVETDILNEADWIEYYENELNMFLNLSWLAIICMPAPTVFHIRLVEIELLIFRRKSMSQK